MNGAQDASPCGDGGGCGSSLFDDTTAALAVMEAGLRDERVLSSHYQAIAWGRLLTPIQVPGSGVRVQGPLRMPPEPPIPRSAYRTRVNEAAD